MQAQKTKNFLQNIKTPFANMIIINEGVVTMEYNKNGVQREPTFKTNLNGINNLSQVK